MPQKIQSANLKKKLGATKNTQEQNSGINTQPTTTLNTESIWQALNV